MALPQFVAPLFILLLAQQSLGFNVFADLYSRPKYDVVFSSQDIVDGDLSNHGNGDGSVKIMALNGMRYVCDIPPDNFTDPNNSVVQSTDIDLVKAKSRALELLGTEVLAGTSSSSNPPTTGCIYYSTGYWTYEVCFSSGVRQFHPKGIVMAGGGVPEPVDPSQTYTLGRFVPSTEFLVKSNGEVAYVSQTLYGGTVCDLTGEERTIEIRYYCKPEVEEEMIGSIREVRTCNYELTIYTPKLCQDVSFIPPKESISNEIICHKIVSQEEQELKRKREEEEKERELLQQKNDNLKIESNGDDTETTDDPYSQDAADDDDSVSIVHPDAADPKVTQVPEVNPEIDYENRIVKVDIPPSDDISEELANAVSSLIRPITDDLHDRKVKIDGKVLSPFEDFEFDMVLVDLEDIPVIAISIVSEDGMLYLTILDDDDDDDDEDEEYILEIPELPITENSEDQVMSTAPPSPAYSPSSQSKMTRHVHDEL